MCTNKQAVMTLVALTSGVLGLAGCQTPVQPYPAAGDPLARANYPKVTVEGALHGFIAVSQPTVEKSDVLKVSVPVRLISRPGEPSNVQFRILFFDASGAPARGGDMNWVFLNLPPQDQRFLVANSLDSDAVDWRCEIRVAR